MLEFDSTRKSMGIIVASKSGSNTSLVKGAVETLLERSSHIQLHDRSVVPLDEKSRKVILASLHGLSTKAPCCLGFAYMEDLAEFTTYDGKYHPAHKLLLDPANYVAIEIDMIFAGLAGLRVAKEDSDMVLADDNFNTIVVTVGEDLFTTT